MNSLSFLRLPRRMATCQVGPCASARLVALVAGVTEGRMLFTMQQCTGDIDVTHVGCGAHHRMYEARLCVQTDVRLHCEVPLP